MTVRELINKVSGKLIQSELIQIYVFNENYSIEEMIDKIEDVFECDVIDFDIWNKEDFKFMFCSNIERMFIESKFFKETRFLTIKVKIDENDE